MIFTSFQLWFGWNGREGEEGVGIRCSLVYGSCIVTGGRRRGGEEGELGEEKREK